ncbi:hypothetical protein WJX82_002872 [Trebouxia sp. C0006]
MLKLDQDSDQKVSVNWRKVASTHSFQELLSKQSEHHKTYGFGTVIWGLILIFAASLLLFGTVFCLVVCKLLPLSENQLMQLIQQDKFYALLVPVTVPVTLVAMTCSWASLKLFKHNS